MIHQLRGLASLARICRNQLSYIAAKFYGIQSRISRNMCSKSLMHSYIFYSTKNSLKVFVISFNMLWAYCVKLLALGDVIHYSFLETLFFRLNKHTNHFFYNDVRFSQELVFYVEYRSNQIILQQAELMRLLQ